MILSDKLIKFKLLKNKTAGILELKLNMLRKINNIFSVTRGMEKLV